MQTGRARAGSPHSQLRRGTIALAALAALFLAEDLRAGNDDLYIKELMAGANGDSRIQFLVVRQRVAGENLWGPQDNETQSRAVLVFFDAAGRETGIFRFPFDPPTGGSLDTLIATQAFADLPGAPSPDVIVPPLVNALAGKICFVNNPANPSADPVDECVSYGDFRGEAAGASPNPTPDSEADPDPTAPALPITDTISLYRREDTGRSSDFTVRTAPAPVNIAGTTFTIPSSTAVEQGAALFHNETFAGNGRTCASCHVASENFMLSPENVGSRFASLAGSTTSYDPLFIGESIRSGFDAGFDFNLNTLVLTEQVSAPAPCTGALRGDVGSESGGRARVLSRIGPARYLVYGGLSPALSGTVTDGACRGTVDRVIPGDLAPGEGAAEGLEDPARMRNSPGRTLILENVDGFASPPVFRRSPHLLNLVHTAPYGFSGDIPDLETFTAGAISQHFPRTLARRSDGTDPDFREPTPRELALIEAFMRAQEFPPGRDPNKFDLARYATTASQRRGREEFVVFGCAACHGGPALSETTISIQGKPVGVNAAFNTGTADSSLPCEPGTPSLGPCGSREFSTPQLFNLPNLGPFFHNGSARTLAEAVDFYFSAEFGSSPSNTALISQGIGVVPTEAIRLFLEGLVARPYELDPGPLRFSERTPVGSVNLRNGSAYELTFDSGGCRLEGADAEEFAVTSCPLSPALAPGESRTIRVRFQPRSDGLKSAILEIHPLGAAPSGIDLFGFRGSGGAAPELTGIDTSQGTAAGGDAITLHGTNFAQGAVVTLGGVRVGFLAVVSRDTITARTAPHAPGTVDVVIINPDGGTARLERGYTYLEAEAEP